MRKALLWILLVVALAVFMGQRYSIKTGKDAKGNYQIVMANKKTGETTRLFGK